MADKQIVELPVNPGITDETLFPAYQPGATEPAQKVSGAQMRKFAEDAGAAAGEQAAGDLERGATFTPHFDPATGLLSWTNDIGLPNPDPVQLSGVTAFNSRSGAVLPQSGDYTADMVGGVALDGSNTMTGNLKVQNSAPKIIAKRSGAEREAELEHSSVATWLNHLKDAKNYVSIRMGAETDALQNLLQLIVVKEGTASDYDLLHAGNFGTYAVGKTGNHTIESGIHTYNVDASLQFYKPNSTRYTLQHDGWNLRVIDQGSNELLSIGSGYGNDCVKINGNVAFHTGNKPSGSYTGNGSYDLRTINTGGIGNVVVVWCNALDTISILAPSGVLAKTGGTPYAISRISANFSDGYIKIGTIDAVLNENGQTYNYQVL